MNPSKNNSKNVQKTVFIIAGEESGDIHGSFLVKELKKIDPKLNFIGHGGDKMQLAGVEIVEHILKLSLVGFTEVIKHLPYIKRVMDDTIKLIRKTNPTRIILIDYPGFNLRLAEKIYKLNIPITYFILPQVWAWKENRVNKLKKYTDQALSIIPFEKDWFKNKSMDVAFVGHPFADMEMPTISKNEYFTLHSLEKDKPLLTLLPGSRQQEIDRHWPIFLQTIQTLRNTFPDLQYLVGKAPNITLSNVPPFVKIEKRNSQLALLHGTAGIVASGTATLEALVFKLPIIVCYKSSAITYWIGKRLSKVTYLSLTNLIANRIIVHEFIQNDMNAKAMVKSIIPLLSNTPEREKVLSNYLAVNSKLGKPGVYQRAAKLISAKF